MSHAENQKEVADHFEEVAKDYDYWKRKNWFYYQVLADIARRNSKPSGALLDVGCGTGAMVAAVAPARALGIDISQEMVALARRRVPNPAYRFEAADITTFSSPETFDTILFFDVVEHVPDTRAALASLSRALAPGGRLVVTMANPLWEPILMVAEKLHLKMPEGPHYRLPVSEFLTLAEAAGLRLATREWRLLFPKYVPGFSWFMNDVIGALPLVKRLAVIEVFIFTKA